MAAVTQTCAKCTKQFLIIDQEQQFLHEKSFPLPVQCPACRQARRLELRGGRKLYRAKCSRCQKEIVTSYDPQTATSPVLCREDYDKWNTESDLMTNEPLPNAPNSLTADSFFQELIRLNNLRPRRPTLLMHTENVEWANSTYFCKNVYWTFDTSKSNDSMYLYNCNLIVKSADCDYSVESELCYECTDVSRCYNCSYLENCNNMRDSHFCVKSSNCHDCFGCVNLRNKSYCIFNRQLTEADYKQLLPKYLAWNHEKVLTEIETLSRRYPWTQTNEQGNINSSFGNYIYNNKNCYLCFDATNNENSGYLYDASNHKSCFDVDMSGESQLSYEMSDSVSMFNCNYVIWSGLCQDSSYIIDCGNCKFCFGCSGLKNKQYVLLNRQLTKEDYGRIVPPLQAEIKSRNLGWGPLKH